MNGELKPCPFCGHEGLKITKKRSGNYRRAGDSIQVICNRCKARGPIFKSKYKEVKDHNGAVMFSLPVAEDVKATMQRAADACNVREAEDENT